LGLACREDLELLLNRGIALLLGVVGHDQDIWINTCLAHQATCIGWALSVCEASRWETSLTYQGLTSHLSYAHTWLMMVRIFARLHSLSNL
jgi:hypothetical protein